MITKNNKKGGYHGKNKRRKTERLEKNGCYPLDIGFITKNKPPFTAQKFANENFLILT